MGDKAQEWEYIAVYGGTIGYTKKGDRDTPPYMGGMETNWPYIGVWILANYELWYCTDLGERLEIISDVQSFEYVKVFGDVGVGIFNIPRRGQIYDNLIPDRRIHIYRQPTKGTLGLELVCFARKFSVTTNIQGHQ